MTTETTTEKMVDITIDLDLLGDLTRSQVSVIRELRATILDDMGGDPKFERFEVKRVGDSRRIGIRAHAIRTDCGRYSPRCVMTEQRAHWFVGPRGGIKVSDSSRPSYATKTDAKNHPFIYGIRKGLS